VRGDKAIIKKTRVIQRASIGCKQKSKCLLQNCFLSRKISKGGKIFIGMFNGKLSVYKTALTISLQKYKNYYTFLVS